MDDRDAGDGTSTESLLRAFRRANLAFDLVGQTVEDGPALGRTDLRLLELLVDGGPLTAGEIARQIGLTTGSVTALIDRLEKAGCVRRSGDPEDGRRRIVAVTARGRRCWTRAFTRLQSIMTTVAGDMGTDDMTAALRFLHRAEEVCRSALTEPSEPAASA